jgi:hypothetical protein
MLGKLKELEKENARLKKLVADLSLDNAILKDGKDLARTGSQSAPKAAQETQALVK